jgi:hypothetical protein
VRGRREGSGRRVKEEQRGESSYLVRVSVVEEFQRDLQLLTALLELLVGTL